MNDLFALAKDGTRIYLHLRGSDAHPQPTTTAVLCDGIGCDGFIWKYLYNDLARWFRVAHWHYRGHGRSALPVDPEAIDIADHANDLGTVCEAIEGGPVILIGHSMGCQVALEYMRSQHDLQSPHHVRALILLCGSYGRVTHTFKGTDLLAQRLPRLIARVEARPELARAIWSRVPPLTALRLGLLLGEVDVNAITPEDLLPYIRHMVDMDLLLFLRILQRAGDHSAHDLLKHIDVPTLVIAGERDTITPPHLAEQIAAELPKGELMVVAGATHVVPLERRVLVLQRIETFLHDHGLITDNRSATPFTCTMQPAPNSSPTSDGRGA